MVKTLAVCLLVASTALAQTSATPDQSPRLTFEVAAIHPSSPDAKGGMIKPLPNGTGYLVQNMTVKTIMSTMYRVPGRQISGGPDWFSTEHFDIEAKADRPHGVEDLHTMFKSLLQDRFGLKFHVETREAPVYALVVDKSGLKMTKDDAPGDMNIPITPIDPGQFEGRKVPIPYLCWFLGNMLHDDTRPVIDSTGLTGLYDFKLSFAPDLPPGVPANSVPPEVLNRPVLKDALPEQLGLDLQARKGPVEEYVIDRLDHPSAN